MDAKKKKTLIIAIISGVAVLAVVGLVIGIHELLDESWIAAYLRPSGPATGEAGLGSVDADLGKVFPVALDSNPTTGFSWQPEFDATALKLVSDVYVASPDSGGLVGAAGQQKFVFLPLKRGISQIKFVYQRPWEKNVPASQTKVFEVRVR